MELSPSRFMLARKLAMPGTVGHVILKGGRDFYADVWTMDDDHGMDVLVGGKNVGGNLVNFYILVDEIAAVVIENI